jgi:hypothetical protein
VGLVRPVRQVSIQILHVPDCPLVVRVRETVRQALARSNLHAEVVELVGAYPSPTLLIDGHDVTGRPPPADQQACAACRLDLPTEQQVLAALARLAGASRTPPPAPSPSGSEGDR